MKWVCPVCGYIHEGDTAPEFCPVCKVPGSKFKKVEGELTLAAEHEFGIYAKTVKNNPDVLRFELGFSNSFYEDGRTNSAVEFSTKIRL